MLNFFLIDHEHANGLAQPLPCDQCGKLFYNPFKLKTHVKRNHVKTQCALCGDMVVANKMSYHIQQVHTRSEDRPHKCPTCGNFTQFYSNLLKICSNLLIEINNMRDAFERGDDPLADTTDASDINSVAGVLKLYFRELREPMFSLQYFDHLMDLSRNYTNL